MVTGLNGKMKLGLAGGLAALLAGGVLFGTVLARPGGPEQAPGARQGPPGAAAQEERFDTFVDKLADNLGVDEQKLRNALVKTRLELLDEAVKDGRLTPEQAERIKQHLQQSGGSGFFGAPHGGRPGPGAGGPHGSTMGGPWVAIASAAEEALGLGPEQLKAKMYQGKSINEIAAELGKDQARVKQQMLEGLRSRIDDAVKAGRLPAERADAMQSGLEQQVDRIMSFKPGQRPTHGPGGPQRRGA